MVILMTGQRERTELIGSQESEKAALRLLSNFDSLRQARA
jgi:hypothetical protein